MPAPAYLHCPSGAAARSPAATSPGQGSSRGPRTCSAWTTRTGRRSARRHGRAAHRHVPQDPRGGRATCLSSSRASTSSPSALASSARCRPTSPHLPCVSGTDLSRQGGTRCVSGYRWRTTADRIVEQARRAEADGFTSMWYPSAAGGGRPAGGHDAGRAGHLGHRAGHRGAGHLLLSSGPPGQPRQRGRVGHRHARAVHLGVGPHTVRHRGPAWPVLRQAGTAHRRVRPDPGRATARRAGELRGQEFRVDAGRSRSRTAPEFRSWSGPWHPGCCGSPGLPGRHVLWMANATAIVQHVAPVIRKAAADAGRPAPRIVAGLPVAVHDNVAEAGPSPPVSFSVTATAQVSADPGPRQDYRPGRGGHRRRRGQRRPLRSVRSSSPAPPISGPPRSRSATTPPRPGREPRPPGRPGQDLNRYRAIAWAHGLLRLGVAAAGDRKTGKQVPGTRKNLTGIWEIPGSVRSCAKF